MMVKIYHRLFPYGSPQKFVLHSVSILVTIFFIFFIVWKAGCYTASEYVTMPCSRYHCSYGEQILIFSMVFIICYGTACFVEEIYKTWKIREERIFKEMSDKKD